MNAVLKPSEKRELLIGCGHSRVKRIHFYDIGEHFENLTTLDTDARANPDVVHDLDVLPYPFADSSFDEIHAYEVLEHCGSQGDWRFFFAQWQEFHRILKPGGYFVGSCPMWDSPWAWGDPGHKRVLTRWTLAFLRQQEYVNQVGKTHMTDYRAIYTGDFETLAVQEQEHSWGFVLRKL
jgi:SAM-dependent methyltransferase